MLKSISIFAILRFFSFFKRSGMCYWLWRVFWHCQPLLCLKCMLLRKVQIRRNHTEQSESTVQKLFQNEIWKQLAV